MQLIHREAGADNYLSFEMIWNARLSAVRLTIKGIYRTPVQLYVHSGCRTNTRKGYAPRETTVDTHIVKNEEVANSLQLPQ